MIYNITKYPFFDTPWDMLIDCKNIGHEYLKSTQNLCYFAKINGFLSAYFLPFIVLLNFICNVINARIFLHGYQRQTRLVIYLGVLSLIDLSACLFDSILRLIPAKGIPYASNGNIFFSINNTSTIGCKLFRSILSFINICKGNILVTTMLDRLLAIQFPVKFGKLTPKYAWYFVISNFVLAIIMLIPIIIQSNWVIYFNQIICYERIANFYLSIYYGLFSEAFVIQTALNGLLNIALVLKIYLWLRHRRRFTLTENTEISNELGACIVLLIISGTTFLLSFPGASAILFGLTEPFHKDSIHIQIRLRFTLSLRDIFLIFIYVQSIFNIIIYIWRMKQFRLLFLRSFHYKEFLMKKLFHINHLHNSSSH